MTATWTDQPGEGGEPEPVPDSSLLQLPEAGSGSRRSRRAQQRIERQRRRRVLVRRIGGAVLAVTIGGGVGAGGWQLVDAALHRRAVPEHGRTATDGAERGGMAAEGERAVIVHEHDGELVGVTVLRGDVGGGGAVLFVPVGTMVEVPSFGLAPLRDAYADGGASLLLTSVENLLGAELDHAEVVDADALGRAIGPAGALEVDLPHAVEAVDDDGRVGVLFPRGRSRVGADRTGELLATPGGATDLDRLVRHEAFWRAWLAAVDEAPGAAPRAEHLGDAAGVVASLAAGDVAYHLLPVEAVAGGAGEDEGLYRVRAGKLEPLAGELFPESAVAGGRVRVQVLNGTGTPGLVQRLQPELVRAGVTVTLTGNADRFDHDTTQIVYYRDDRLDQARALRDALGAGEVVRSMSGLIVVDLTVVVGEDLASPRSVEGDEREGG